MAVSFIFCQVSTNLNAFPYWKSQIFPILHFLERMFPVTLFFFERNSEACRRSAIFGCKFFTVVGFRQSFMHQNEIIWTNCIHFRPCVPMRGFLFHFWEGQNFSQNLFSASKGLKLGQMCFCSVTNFQAQSFELNSVHQNESITLHYIYFRHLVLRKVLLFMFWRPKTSWKQVFFEFPS